MAIFMMVAGFIFYRNSQRKQMARILQEKDLSLRQALTKREALDAELNQLRSENEKLRGANLNKDKELANRSMGLIQKDRLLIKVTEELLVIHELIEDGSAKDKISSLRKKINRDVDSKQQNNIFEAHFDEAHKDFFDRLRERYPILTPNDLRMCGFIKMNISTKKIANILNISYRGAEISRYRLRKKLELSREVNFSTFLANF
jgi:DNA-binding CsgD family transcriptional regulator